MPQSTNLFRVGDQVRKCGIPETSGAGKGDLVVPGAAYGPEAMRREQGEGGRVPSCRSYAHQRAAPNRTRILRHTGQTCRRGEGAEAVGAPGNPLFGPLKRGASEAVRWVRGIPQPIPECLGSIPHRIHFAVEHESDLRQLSV